ncbi:MAG TPA: DUF3135 domain-containing protein [Marinagarivorans sp.]
MQSQWPTANELIKLAQEDPDALEALRQREIDALINAAPASMQRRLRGLQFQIDAKRSISKTPMASCMAISQMMFDSVYELNDALNGDGSKTDTEQSREQADILSFPAALSV